MEQLYRPMVAELAGRLLHRRIRIRGARPQHTKAPPSKSSARLPYTEAERGLLPRRARSWAASCGRPRQAAEERNSVSALVHCRRGGGHTHICSRPNAWPQHLHPRRPVALLTSDRPLYDDVSTTPTATKRVNAEHVLGSCGAVCRSQRTQLDKCPGRRCLAHSATHNPGSSCKRSGHRDAWHRRKGGERSCA